MKPLPAVYTAVAVYGKLDPFLKAWLADPRGNILVRGPIHFQGGIYHFHVLILNHVSCEQDKIRLDQMIDNLASNTLICNAIQAFK